VGDPTLHNGGMRKSLIFLFFVRLALAVRLALGELLRRTVASTFLCRFGCGFQRFRVMPEPLKETRCPTRCTLCSPFLGDDAKVTRECSENRVNVEQNGAKLCFGHLQAKLRVEV